MRTLNSLIMLPVAAMLLSRGTTGDIIFDPQRGEPLGHILLPSGRGSCPLYIASRYTLFLDRCSQRHLEGITVSVNWETISTIRNVQEPFDVVGLALWLGESLTVPPLKDHVSISFEDQVTGLMTKTTFPFQVDRIPSELQLTPFSELGHGVSSASVWILNANTFYIPDLHYDGLGPQTHFWVGRGEPDVKGRWIPDQNNSLGILKGYSGENVSLALPGVMTVHDLDYLSFWCRQFEVTFGQVRIPEEKKVPPSFYNWSWMF